MKNILLITICLLSMLLKIEKTYAPQTYYTANMVNMMIEKNKRIIEREKLYTRLHKYLIIKGYKGRVKERSMIVNAIYTASEKYSLPISLIAAVIETESSWRPDVVSHKGARGLMQIMPVWDDELYKNALIGIPEHIFEPHMNIFAGCYILNRLLLHEGDLNRALRRYNTGSADESKAGKIYIGKVREAMERIQEELG